MATDNKRKLYDALSQDYDMGSYEQFCADLNDEGKRRKLYDATSQEYDLGTWDSFSQQLGYGQAAAPAPEQSLDKSVADTSSMTTPRESRDGGDWHPSEQDKVDMQRNLDDSMSKFDDSMRGMSERFARIGLQNTADGRKRTAMARQRAQISGTAQSLPGITRIKSGSVSVEGRENTNEEPKPQSTSSPVPYDVVIEKGEKKTRWLLPDGSLTTKLYEADYVEAQARTGRLAHEFEKRMTDNGLNPAIEEDRKEQERIDILDVSQKRLNMRLARNESEIRDIYDEKAEDFDRQMTWNDDEGFWSNFQRIVGGSVNRGERLNVPKPKDSLTTQDKDLRILTSENAVLKEARNRLETRKLRKSEGFMGGFWNIGNNSRNMAMGAKHTLGDLDLYAGGIMSMQKASQLLEIEDKLKAGADLSDAEVNLVYSTMLGQDVAHNTETPHGYNAAQITVEMFPFMAQMILNPASGLSRALVTKYGNTGLKKIALTVAGDLAESAVLANTLQAPATIADAMERYQGEAIVKDGRIEFDGRHKWGEAIYKAEGAAIIENYTEMLGEHFGVIGNALGKGLSKGMTKIGGGKVVDAVTDFVAKVGATDWAKGISALERRAHWNGTTGEILEEEAGIVLNSIFVGDNKISDLWDADQQIDIVLGVGLFGGFVSGVKSVGYPIARAKAKSKLRERDNIGGWRFSDRWTAIREEINNADEKNLSETVNRLIRDNATSNEQARSIVEYAQALMNARGYEIASASMIAEGGVAPEMADTEECFEHGANIAESGDAQAMADAQNMYESLRTRVEEVFVDPEMIGQFDNDPVVALMALSRNRLYLPEEVDLARDYINSKTVRDGMLQRVIDDIDEKIALSDAMIRARVNSVNGLIQPAVMGLDDRQVYVVGGSLALNDDGSIDRDASDESIVVRDAVTGKLEFTDPKSIVSVGEAIDPEMEMAIAVDNIRQQAAQQAADAMNGTLAFNPGDVVQINDGGDLADVTIVGPVVDEKTGMPIEGQVMVQFPNGQQIPFTKERLQAFADAANLDRLNDFEQERAVDRARQEAVETESMRPQFALNDEFTILNDDGTPIRGSITGELDEDGTVEIYTEEPINGNRVNRLTPAELEEMLDTYNGEAITMPVPENVESVPIVEGTPDDGGEIGANPAETVPSPEGVVEAVPQTTALSRIPVDEQGQPKYDEAEPDTAWDAIVEQAQGDEATAAEVVADIVAERQADFNAAEKALDKTKEGKPEKRKEGEPAPTMAERIAAKNAAKEALAEAQAIRDRAKAALDHWKRIADTKQRREAEFHKAEEARLRAEQEEAKAREEEAKAERKAMARIGKQYADVYDTVKSSAAAVERLQQTDPETLDEVAAWVLSGSKILWGNEGGAIGMRGETGYGNGERKKLFSMFASKEKGGRSLRELSEDVMLEACEQFGVPYDNQDAFNALLGVLQGAMLPSDITRYIQNARMKQALEIYRLEEEQARNEYDAWCEEQYHLSAEEFEAYEEQMVADLEKALKDFDENEFYSNIADAIIERQKEEHDEHRRNEADESAGESTDDGRGGEVLPESQPDQRERAGADEEGQGVREANGHEGAGAQGPLREGASVADSVEADGADAYTTKSPIAFAYYTDGVGVIESTEFLLMAVAGAFPSAMRAIDGIRARYGKEITGDVSMSNPAIFVETELAERIRGEIKDVIEATYKDGEKGSLLVDYLFRNPTGVSRKDAAMMELHLEELEKGRRAESLQERIKAAEAAVDTDPTPAQKEAGNYKKGHVQVGTFDVTIEQPVGSVRRGTDANGKAWETTMQNTYGYIRGTQSVDGDHIDVFLSTDIDAWNGRRVVVVDQYNPDGTFDEHKVMLGFNDKDDAVNAYLANYEDGWEKGRRLVFSSATLEDFEKWIESSHRKHKPYNEYKIADKAEVEESTPENPVSITDGYTIDTYTTKKNETCHRVVFPRADKAVWQERLNLAKKMGGTSVPKGYGFKTREEAEAFAKAVKDPATVADAQPLSLDDMRSSIEEDPTATTTDGEQETEDETQQPEADKPVNPSGNKLVTDERYAELRERMRKKLGGQLNMGIDPEILAIGTEMAVYHIEKGARKFKAYASAMIADLGDAIRPYLKSFYNAVRDMPEAEAAGLVADMDSYDEVRGVDIANFDKPGTDAMATAAAVVAEQEAEKEREEAEAKLKEKRKKHTNPDGSTTETVVESGTEIEITSGNFIPGVRPTVDEQKPGKKRSGKTKPKPTTEDGLSDTVEDDTVEVPALAVPEQRPAADLVGDSAAYQEREAQTVELVEEIGGVIENRVAMLQLDAESVKPLTMADVKKMVSKYTALKDISDTDLQELVELAMTQLTRSEALVNIDGTAEAQRRAYDHIVDLYHMQPSLNARDSERLMKQQYSTPTPFGFVMGQFVRAGGKAVGSMLEPSAGNGALTITVHPSLVHVNDIDDARLANLRKLGYGQVTAQDALLPFAGDKVDVVMTNPPFGTVTEKVYDGVFRISSLEGQMAINALEQMKDDGRAAIVVGGNTSYRTNGSMNPKDAAFFGYLYSHYNVADVINISGKALYSRNGTGYDVRMILIDGRKTGEFERVFPPVKAKARAEQATTFDELYKRVQDDIQQIQQMGSQSADVRRDTETAADGTAGAPVRRGNNRPNTGAGQRPGTTGDTVRDTPRTDSGQPTPGNDGSRPAGVDNAVTGNAGSTDNVPQPKPQQPRSVGSGSAQDGTGRSGSDGRGAVASRPDRGAERLAVKPDLTTEKVPYPNQSENGFTLMSVVPAAQAQVLQKSLGEIGDVDQYLVDELGYSSKEELYKYLAAEQVDSVALAIHQMNKGNAFIIGDMTGVGKGRQGAALIRYAVKQGKVPIYFTQKPTLFTDNYRDLADIGSSDLHPFIIASNPKDANIVDADGNIVHKLPSKKEQERVFNYIMEHGTLPEEYDYVLTTYDQIKNGTADYAQNEDGTWNVEARKLPKRSKGYTTADHNGQARRDALARLAEGNIAILDESHTVGGDSGCGRYMQMLTSSAEGVTFLSATFAKRADNMPIYAQRTAIAEAGVKASELIEAISKGGVTLQEIMSKQLVESGQMIRRERSFEGVTIDWLSVEEETNRRQRQQFNEVADIFNAIRNFQDDYITPIIDAKNETVAEFGATVGHTQGTKDMGVKNVPFASKMYNLVNQLLFALKVDAVADRVVENLRNGYKPVISFTNTMEGFLSSAPKGVAMDDVPNFSLTLMRALDGVMRFTEKDADENTEGGSIFLSELSTDGQNAYNAIREKIINLSADLPISPMDAIRMKIEEAGYSVAEITGRTMQLNRTEDGRYIVEARKDRDKKAAMRDFNSGKLDVLMINKSGSTGISLHASSKFEDQRPRVMVFAQFQSDINDEVQMRGRIDRSGQVTRGRYEYIMSTIPAEQRIQMMFKAKLKSLDANTTSSQKSKFNEMEIVDYLNKYGDDVVWEYMKEHPELEERLGDPLDMLQDKNAEDGPRTSEKEDTSKKTGCAGKISRYLAFLSVEEQDEIFREITEAYRVKIQLLDDAGENDLEITTMPLRAETKQKKIWHEGENPGSGNAFADNTYVEEMEVDVLKKPMKRDEITEATRKLMGEHYTEKNGGVDWQHYVRAKGDEISLFFQAKADEAVGKLKEAGEARIAKAREKAVTAATKARGRGENNFTNEQIESLADTVANEEREKELQKQRKRQEEIMAIKHRLQSLLQRLRAGGIYVVPQDLKQGTAEMFTQTFGTFVGFKFNKGYTLGSSTAIFATLDGRRKVELALSDQAINTIISATDIANRYSPDEIRAISLDNWDSKVPTQTRQKRYIITGNLLQALVDTEKGEKTRGNLISFSTIEGETRQGILMGENFKLTDLRNSASLSSRLGQIREGKAVVSENGDVQIEKVSFGWQHRGQYELRVPKSKQRGGVYTMHHDLLKLVDGHNFITKGNNMIAYVDEADIEKVVDMLSRAPFNLTVLLESRLSDVTDVPMSSEAIAEYSAENANFARRYETTDGKTISYVSEIGESYGGLFDFDFSGENEGGNEVNNRAGADDVQRQGGALLDRRDSGLDTEAGEFSVVERVFTENGSFDFTSGERIESAADVAFIFSALEDAAKEHSFVVLVKDGKPTVVELGMGTFTATMVDIPTAALAYNRIRPDRVYFVHNHPSGNLVCSSQDVQMLRKIGELSDVPVSGVIINLRTGKYGTFDMGGNSDVGRKRIPQTENALVVHTLDKQIFARDYDPMAQPLVRGSSDVAKFLNSHRMGDRGKVSFLILSRAGRIVGNIHTPYTEIPADVDEMARYVSERVIQFGGESAILYGDFGVAVEKRIAYRKLKERMSQVGGTNLLDVVIVKGNHTTSANDEGLLYRADMTGGRGRFGQKRQAELAARERGRMGDRVKELAERMHLENVEIVTDAGELEGKQAKAKGFYNKRTGKITIVIPNNVGTIDAEQTLLHEAVAHYGLRQLFGGQFDTFLDNVYQSADEGIRRKIAEMAAGNGWDFRTATEEYLAGLAEDTDFGEAQSHAGWWSKIKRLFVDMLEHIGFEGFRDKVGVVLTDNELRYILWRSYENLAEPGRYRSILGEAADVAKQSELKVGNYAETGLEAEYAAEEELYYDNGIFNSQLQLYIDGKLDRQEALLLGMPKGVMKLFLPYMPIIMRQRILHKASEKKHNVAIDALTDMPAHISKPIFVFQRFENTIGILTEMKDRDGKNICVAIEMNKEIQDGKEVLMVNDIRSVHGRETRNIIEPILQNGTLKYVDKEKGLEWLSSASSSYQQEIANQDLVSVAKIIDSFENPTIEGEELFRPGDFAPRDKVLARDCYERVCASGGYQFKEAVQDSMLGLKELYRAIWEGADALGRKQNFRIEDVPGFENAYLFENRMSSMNAGEQHEYFQRYMQPLLKEIGRIAGANKRKRKELTDYIMAKHGLERNEYMRNEAAANGEDTDRDFAGLMGLTGEADWQNAEDTARQWVDDYEDMVDTTDLWEAINKATKATLEKVYLSGMISKETYEKILGMYDYYVPLRGWDETTSEQVYGYLTSKEGPLGGSIMKKAEGRESMADDPIATIGMMADDAIRQGNRNLMKQRFLNFVFNHPSDAVSVHDIWLKYDAVDDEWVPVFADVENTDTADEVAQKVEAFEQRMEALRTAEPDKYKKGREAQHIPYKVVRGNLREHQILIKRNGRTFVATINGNPRAAQAINGLTNPDVDQNGVAGNMLKLGTWVNRQLSAFYTTRNPDFVVGNFFRDMLYSNCMTWVKESPRYARRFHKNFGRVNPMVMRRLLGKWENGTLDMSNRLESLFYQFMKNGGETGYTNVRDIEGHKRAVAAELKKQGSTGRRAWRALGMQLDLLNRSAENCARFAAFMTSREFGRSIDRAIYDAKEISVNFNKKGSGGKMVNANGQTALGKTGAYLSGGGRLLYVFWNAGIQGMTNFGRQAKLHPAKFSAGATALFTLGYVIPLLAQMLGGGDGDDDDKNAYYNLPEYVRRSNICFYAGDQWITIPLPIEYRAMYGMGELAHGVISGNERYSNSELARQMASQVSQIFPIDMLEGGGGISPFIPSAAKPFTEAYIMNKGWTGLPVYKDTPFNKNNPEWTKAYASADKHLVDFAKWLNETSGGDDFKKGAIDINPAKIEYLLNGTFGGMFTFPNKIKKSIETAAGSRDFEWRNMPIANRLIKSGDERTANRKLQNEYFKYKDEFEETGRLMRKYENAKDNGILGYAERVDFLENSPRYLRYEIFDDFKADLDAYREIIATETDDAKEAKLNAEMFGLMRELVDALHDPASYFRKMYAAGGLSDEYIEYLEKSHGIRFENAEGE